jgi:hypothetical protein
MYQDNSLFSNNPRCGTEQKCMRIDAVKVDTARKSAREGEWEQEGSRASKGFGYFNLGCFTSIPLTHLSATALNAALASAHTQTT